MNRKVTVLDVADRAGVAPGTVSRTLNNIGYVKAETREKVLKAVNELNYIPNRMGRTLKTTRTNLIMLAIPDTANAIFVGMIEAVNERAKENGFSMVLYYTEGKLEGELRAVRMLQENLVDGLFLINFSYSQELRDALEQCQAPIVLCGMCRSPWVEDIDRNFDIVSIDVYGGIYQSTVDLIKRGHKRIGYLAGESGTIVYRQRYEAFLQALKDNHIEYYDKFVFWKDYTEQHGYESAEKMFTMENGPTAVVASNDLQAIGFWKACKDYNKSVPGDYSLCGMDNLDVTEFLDISSIRMHENEVGESGCNMIMERLKKMDSSMERQSVLFVPELVRRKSSTLDIV